ncbi:hypothetical protein AURDEDRAFT_163052 [Auricularia subglabra TFB-10046 SS5]|nr:hypothetical protein AURDEDRAFT_163052 [Auricularia subglabra TFB-10046 SS5]
MATLDEEPAVLDFSDLPSLHFDVEFQAAHGRQTWVMTFSDTSWEHRPFIPRAPVPCPPTRFLVDEAPIIYEDEIRRFVADHNFENNLALAQFASTTQN